MSESKASSPFPDESARRCLRDRRQRSPFLSRWYWGFRGRRRTIRREADRAHVHLDYYPAHLLVVVLGIFMLAQADTVLTLLMLDTGKFIEANPLMQLLIDRDVHWFVNVRSLVWGLLLITLVAIAGRLQVWRVRPRRIIKAVAIVYFAQIAGMFAMLMAAG